MFSLPLAYVLWLFSGCGALGFHRFYLGKIPTGLLWMCTGGLGMIGSIYDFFTLPGQVREANIRKALYDGSMHRPAGIPDWRYAEEVKTRVVEEPKSRISESRIKESLEHTILRIAKENKGILTVSEVALGANISIEEARKHLDTLATKGFAELRVRKSGSLVYVITDMADKDEPFEDI